MDQKKIGQFIKELRKQKGITQELLAEKMNTSRRTISRWENGANMPDLDMIPELADYFEIEIKEFFNAGRMSESNEEIKDTVIKAAEYVNTMNKRATITTVTIFIVGLVSLIINQVLFMLELPSTFIVGFLRGLTMGVAFGALLTGILYCTGLLTKIQNSKRRLIKKVNRIK